MGLLIYDWFSFKEKKFGRACREASAEAQCDLVRPDELGTTKNLFKAYRYNLTFLITHFILSCWNGWSCCLGRTWVRLSLTKPRLGSRNFSYHLLNGRRWFASQVVGECFFVWARKHERGPITAPISFQELNNKNEVIIILDERAQKISTTSNSKNQNNNMGERIKRLKKRTLLY